MKYKIIFLIFKESGRLGNQLFQYAALKTFCKSDQRLILYGFDSLQSAFDGIDAIVVNSNTSRLERSFYKIIYRYADKLSKKGFFHRLKESKVEPKFILGSGLASHLTFVEESYCQSEVFFDKKVITSLKLKPDLLNKAQGTLASLPEGKVPIFVHIRRGDYLVWPSRDSPAVLPASYYWNCMNKVIFEIPEAFWIFVSDDFYYVKDVFGNVENSYISRGSIFEDFTLMTQCLGGILSASSFAWWAAYFARTKQPDSFFLAPCYWSGHRKRSWYPAFIKTSSLQYIDVEET